MNKIKSSGKGSFLAVLKLFGKQDSLLSFPMEGYTLALDFPVTSSVLKFLCELDELVIKHNGRIYLAKDARMKSEVFQKTYPHLKEFLQLKNKYDKSKKFQSLQSKRLGI